MYCIFLIWLLGGQLWWACALSGSLVALSQINIVFKLLLHYLVKCRSRSLTIDNNEFILGSACVSSENYWDHKIIENLLLRLYFKIVSRQTEMTSTTSGPLESCSYWTCCWQMAWTSTAYVCAARGHFEHMLKWRWCDVTRETFWVIIIVNCVCRYSVNNFWADAYATQ